MIQGPVSMCVLTTMPTNSSNTSFFFRPITRPPPRSHYPQVPPSTRPYWRSAIRLLTLHSQGEPSMYSPHLRLQTILLLPCRCPRSTKFSFS
jgi:hypothetical protein